MYGTIYIQHEVLYHKLQAALIFWKLISLTLQDWGFKINQFDQCVTNKTINGKQCTIVDMLLTLKYHTLRTRCNRHTKTTNSKESQFKTNRRKVLEYLGMTIYYRQT